MYYHIHVPILPRGTCKKQTHPSAVNHQHRATHCRADGFIFLPGFHIRVRQLCSTISTPRWNPTTPYHQTDFGNSWCIHRSLPGCYGSTQQHYFYIRVGLTLSVYPGSRESGLVHPPGLVPSNRLRVSLIPTTTSYNIRVGHKLFVRNWFVLLSRPTSGLGSKIFVCRRILLSPPSQGGKLGRSWGALSLFAGQIVRWPMSIHGWRNPKY